MRAISHDVPQKRTRRILAGNAVTPEEGVPPSTPGDAIRPPLPSPTAGDDAHDPDIVRELRSRIGTGAAEVVDPLARPGRR
jgi:hypothetical protein